jgi:hypothetical protein
MNNIVIGVAVFLVLVAAWWYYTYRYNTFLVAKSNDGTEIAISCGDTPIKIISANYSNVDTSTDVTAKLQDIFNNLPKNVSSYKVNAADFGLAPSADGGLTFRYKCQEKNNFANRATHDRLMNFVRQREIRHSGNDGDNSTRNHELGALILPANNFCY